MAKFGMKFVSLMAVAALSMVAFAGCNTATGDPEQNADDIIEEAFTSFSEAESMSFDLSGEFKVDNPEDPDLSGSGSFSFVGFIDVNDTKAPQMQLEMNFSASDSIDTLKAVGEMRMDKDNIYASLQNLSGFGLEFFVPEEAMSEVLNKWWSLPIPPGSFDELKLGPVDDADLTPEEREVKRLFEEAEFFGDIEYQGEEGGNYHYVATLDPEEAEEFIESLIEVGGSSAGLPPLTAAEREEMEKVFETLDLKTEMWISKSSELKKVSMEFTLPMDAGVPDLGNVTASFTGSFDDYGKKFKIEVPKDAEEFDPFSFMTLGMEDDFGDFGEGIEVEFDESFEFSEEDLAEFEALQKELEAL